VFVCVCVCFCEFVRVRVCVSANVAFAAKRWISSPAANTLINASTCVCVRVRVRVRLCMSANVAFDATSKSNGSPLRSRYIDEYIDEDTCVCVGVTVCACVHASLSLQQRHKAMDLVTSMRLVY